ncbi:MAG TPA: hydroxylamine reductase [Spirochaetales bacterium]|nr:hydroxylamine reductase [Spirochaetales bacterium]HOV38195.1 hydroxylamine reductase [Spirochaetales bacterium]
MFCFQCQETARNEGCTIRGVCGKQESTAGLQDLLIHTLKGISWYASRLDLKAKETAGRFIVKGLFATITNANFDDDRFLRYIDEGLLVRDSLKHQYEVQYPKDTTEKPDAAVWFSKDPEVLRTKAGRIGVLSTTDPDLRSLREFTVYGLKGISAYTHHAEVLGYTDPNIWAFLVEALNATLEQKTLDEMTELLMRTGETAVAAMALLDKANTSTYGNPEITEVNIGVRNNPGILISGHDLKDMEELLKQTEGTGVDVYTHSEMLPAHYYPAFKRYPHFAGNYGNAWWKQDKEFAQFNGPIVMTTNCIVPVRDAYKDRIFTTGVVGFPGVKHIPDQPDGKTKDFSEVIALAKTCPPPTEIEQGKIVGGFAHAQLEKLADTIVDAVKKGAIKRFVVMGGCDGRQSARSYFTEVAQELPKDSVILTAGCAKYRYNKLDLGTIDGIPRVLDAGQCNDSYSLALIALKLKDVFGVKDVNDLPIYFDIAWYEQKAVAVLLALLYLGFKGIRLGPTLPAFVSPNIVKFLVEKFGIQPISDAKTDVGAMLVGKRKT